MSQYVFTPPVQPSIAVQGSTDRFPIRRVFCVGRNYAAHAKEMGSDPTREPPFFFMKPADAVIPASGEIPYPPLTADFHHEIELVVAIGTGGINIKREDALQCVWGYGVGVDLTRRDLQAAAKKQGHPWDWAKGFDASAPCSAIYPVTAVGHPKSARIWLEVNGTLKQEGNMSDLIWPVADIISTISQAVALQPGDLIYTGTPSGVGALLPGDQVRGGVEGITDFTFSIKKPT
ncbi:MAG: fumarylacetoacetate hydrolase family protein [Pseudomonadota bacterium]